MTTRSWNRLKELWPDGRVPSGTWRLFIFRHTVYLLWHESFGMDGLTLHGGETRNAKKIPWSHCGLRLEEILGWARDAPDIWDEAPRSEVQAAVQDFLAKHGAVPAKEIEFEPEE